MRFDFCSQPAILNGTFYKSTEMFNATDLFLAPSTLELKSEESRREVEKNRSKLIAIGAFCALNSKFTICEVTFAFAGHSPKTESSPYAHKDTFHARTRAR